MQQRPHGVHNGAATLNILRIKSSDTHTCRGRHSGCLCLIEKEMWHTEVIEKVYEQKFRSNSAQDVVLNYKQDSLSFAVIGCEINMSHKKGDVNYFSNWDWLSHTDRNNLKPRHNFMVLTQIRNLRLRDSGTCTQLKWVWLELQSSFVSLQSLGFNAVFLKLYFLWSPQQ